MEPTPSDRQRGGRVDWSDRERYWTSKLGRIRLGAEPIEEQVARYRRVTWALTVVPLGLWVFFVALFSAFRRPDVGLVLASVLMLPIVLLAWIDFGLLRRRVSRYERERRTYQEPSASQQSERAIPLGNGGHDPADPAARGFS